jgi:hypothetical protein
MVRIRQIVKHGQVDRIDAHRGTSHRHGRHNPWDVRELRPAQPEEADRQEGALDAGEVEAALRGCGGFVIVGGDFLLVNA